MINRYDCSNKGSKKTIQRNRILRKCIWYDKAAECHAKKFLLFKQDVAFSTFLNVFHLESKFWLSGYAFTTLVQTPKAYIATKTIWDRSRNKSECKNILVYFISEWIYVKLVAKSTPWCYFSIYVCQLINSQGKRLCTKPHPASSKSKGKLYKTFSFICN